MPEEESKLLKKLEESNKQVKFTKEELNQVKNIQKDYQNAQTQFGQLKLAQISLDNDEITLEENFKLVQEKEKKFLDGITEKYGQGSLNPETGVFTPTESKNKSE